MRFSIVVPVFDEAENIGPVVDELLRVLAPSPAEEILFIDDGSTDDTLAVLRARSRDGTIRLLRHPRRLGKSAGLRTGIRAARTDWVVLLDGDGQNDPADIPALLERAAGRDAPALISGVRAGRVGRNRRIASRIGNGVRQFFLRDGCPDSASGIKLLRRDAYLDLPYFAANHRFLPALFQIQGHRVAYVAVRDRPRLHGSSKYGNLSRALVGIVDLLGVCWLKRRTQLPETVSEVAPVEYAGEAAATAEVQPS